MTARHPRLYWPLVIGLSVLTGAVIQQRVAALDRARSRWETTVTVWVAAHDLEVGESLAGNVRGVQMPTAVAPPSALTQPVGTVRQAVDEGAPLTRADVSARTDELALVPDGWVAVAVIEDTASGSTSGDRVDIASEGMVIVTDAVVVGDVDQATLVAVPPGSAATVAAANDSAGVALIRWPDRLSERRPARPPPGDKPPG